MWDTPEYQQRTVDGLWRHPVPIVLWQAPYVPIVEKSFPLVYEHLSANYVVAQESTFGSGPSDVWQVLVHRDAVPTGTYERFRLPCFA
jgi:hypothetical protein